MKRTSVTALATIMGLALAGCGKSPCSQLQEKVCADSQGSKACSRAKRLTNDDECAGYLKDVARYIELMNTEVDKQGVKPPPVPVKTGQAEKAPVEKPAAVGVEGAAPAPAEKPAAGQGQGGDSPAKEAPAPRPAEEPAAKGTGDGPAK